MSDIRRAYIAGPMRGYPMHNFAAFAEAAEVLRAQGWEVVSPAEMDLANGYDGSRPPTEDELIEMFERDLAAIDTVDYIILLPGWESSVGVATELKHAAKDLHPDKRPGLVLFRPESKSVTYITWQEIAPVRGVAANA